MRDYKRALARPGDPDTMFYARGMRRTVGPYQLVARLGSGPGGDVHLAHLAPETLAREGGEDAVLAIRIYHPEIAQNTAFTDMLGAEREGAIGFVHEGAVRTLEIGRGEESELFLAMELVEGQPLTALLQRLSFERKRLSDPMIVWIVAKAAEALFASHQTPWQAGADSSIVHGGLSPNAIALSYDGKVRVRGMGVGRSHMMLAPSHTRLAYRAPEVIEGKGFDRRADIYGLGVILYDALSGRRAFKRRTVEDTQAAVLEHFVEPLRDARPDLQPGLDELITAMMARARVDRPKSLSEIITYLHTLYTGHEEGFRQELAGIVGRCFSEEARAQRKMIDAVLRPRSDSQKRPISSPAAPKSDRASEISIEPPAGAHPSEEELVLAKAHDFIVTPPRLVAPEKPSLDPTTDISGSNAALELPATSQSEEFVVLSDELANFLSAHPHEPGQTQVRRDARPKLEAPSAPEPMPTVPKRNGSNGDHHDKTRPPAAPGSLVSSDIARSPTPDTLEPGQMIGEKYKVIGPLGEGGMGVVYRVEHVLMQKELALKLLRAEISMIPQIARRFEREARAACQLDHPNIVRVTDFGREPNGTLFLVMELLEGESLLDRLATGAHLTVEEGLDIIEQVLAALEHAHKHAVIHRDLKPDNVMLVPRDGRVVAKLLDFGVAKMAALPIDKDRPPLTQTGMIFGTPQYMSPEQASGEPVDGRADLYTVGVMLYQILTKRLPFDGETTQAVLARQITQPPPPLGLMLPDPELELALENLLSRALAKERDKRFQSPSAFMDALHNLHARDSARDSWTVPVRRPEDPASLASDLQLPPPVRTQGGTPPRPSS